MRVVFLLKALFSCRVEVAAADSYDVVAAVGRGVVDRLVFAHEGDCDRAGDAAE